MQDRPAMLFQDLSLSVFVALTVGILLAGLALDFMILARLGEWRRRWASAVASLRARPWTLTDAARMTLALFSAHLLGSAVFLLLHGGGGPDVEPRLAGPHFYIWGTVPTIVVLGAAWFMIRAKDATWEQAFGCNWRAAGRHSLLALKFYLAFMPLFMLVAFLYGWLLKRMDAPLDPQPTVELFTDPALAPTARIYLALIAVLGAPLAEEILFRGVALPALLKKMGPVPALAVLSLIFALVHLHVPSLAPLFVVSVALSAGFILSGSLLVPILMHSLFNAVSLTLNLLVNSL